MAYLSDSPVLGILSRDHSGAQSPASSLGKDGKRDIEVKLSGKSEYGAKTGGSSAVMATNEVLKYLNLIPDTKKLQLIEMQNNAKENIRSLYGIPKDIEEATSGKTKGSTYENQQFAEARFIETVPKSITDKWLNSLMRKSPMYFKERGTKLIGSYDHLPSVIKLKEVDKSKGLKDKMDAFNRLLEANMKLENTEVNLDIQNWMKLNGLEDLL